MTAVALALIVGATIRATRLLQIDTILDRPRTALIARLERAGRARLVELARCPWCLSVWVGALVAGSWLQWGHTRWWAAAGAALTASLLAGVHSTWEDR